MPGWQLRPAAGSTAAAVAVARVLWQQCQLQRGYCSLGSSSSSSRQVLVRLLLTIVGVGVLCDCDQDWRPASCVCGVGVHTLHVVGGLSTLEGGGAVKPRVWCMHLAAAALNMLAVRVWQSDKTHDTSVTSRCAVRLGKGCRGTVMIGVWHALVRRSLRCVVSGCCSTLQDKQQQQQRLLLLCLDLCLSFCSQAQHQPELRWLD
jgi:hypothetical protein